MSRAYTALLMQFPPLAVGIVAALSGFLGSALPGVGLSRLGAGRATFEGGLLWGVQMGAALSFVLGLVVLFAVQRAGRTRARALQAALAITACAMTGPCGALLGAFAGSALSGDEWPTVTLRAGTLLPGILAPVLLGVAALASAKPEA